MSDVLAIVSKPMFERVAGKNPTLGARLRLDRYVSANKGLVPLTGGGRLFLVTVRPPAEALWLVAVLDAPKFTGTEWVATPADTPLTDVTALRDQLKFETGKGLPDKVGALAMSLQTPRVLTPTDAALLLGTPGSARAPAPAPTVDTARARLTEVDLALRGRLTIPVRRELTAERGALLSANGKRWWPWDVEGRQRGGSLVAVTADAETFLRVAPTVFAAEPVTEVELLDVDEDTVAKIATAPWLGKITALALRGELGDDGFATLIRSKQAQSLRALNVSVNEIGPNGIGALKSGMPALARLVLTRNPLEDDGAEALARWIHLDGVRELYLSACDVTVAGLAALLDSGRLAGLERLTLAGNPIGDEGAQMLAAHAARLPKLRHLELVDIGAGRDADAALAAAPFARLRRLDLRRNGWQFEKLRARYRDGLRV